MVITAIPPPPFRGRPRRAPLGPGNRQRRQPAADEPAEVPADRDAGDGEREDEVQHHEEADLRCHLVHPLCRAMTKAAAIRPKIAPLAPTVTSVGSEQQRAEQAGEQGREVDAEKAGRADRGLDQRAEDVEGEHVQQQVEGAGVQERAADDAPDLTALGDHRARALNAADAAVADRVAADAAVNQGRRRRASRRRSRPASPPGRRSR